MKVRMNVKGFTDRRTPALLGAAQAIEQAHADNAIEALWRRRVEQNEARRWMRAQNLPSMFWPQAD